MVMIAQPLLICISGQISLLMLPSLSLSLTHCHHFSSPLPLVRRLPLFALQLPLFCRSVSSSRLPTSILNLFPPPPSLCLSHSQLLGPRLLLFHRPASSSFKSSPLLSLINLRVVNHFLFASGKLNLFPHLGIKMPSFTAAEVGTIQSLQIECTVYCMCFF